MSNMSSLSIAVSGLRAAQSGLSVTGHNMSNSDVKGYTRQSSVQETFIYKNLGLGGTGLLQTGLGSDISSIRQLRNRFLDAEYRTTSGTASYYAAKYTTGQEVENILGELESSYAAQDVLRDVWSALNELTIYPEGIETRGTFIETCSTFLNKMKDISSGLFEYQLNLNEQVKTYVNKINDIVKDIDTLNDKITEYEADGKTKANDYRDQRNLLVDELSTYLKIDVKEIDNRVDILSEGKELLVNGARNNLGLRYTTSKYPFVEPVFSEGKEIMAVGDKAISLFGDLSEQNLTSGSDRCSGMLKGIMVSRGAIIADSTMNYDDISMYTIPSVKWRFDNLTRNIAELLNDSFSSGKTFDLKGGTGVEIFTKINKDLGYTIDNIEINPELLKSDGYNKLALSASGDIGDATAVLDVIGKWDEGIEGLDNMSVNNYYRGVIDDIAIDVDEAGLYYDEHTEMSQNVESKRAAYSGVSLDEELSNMLKYQYAYQAAAKVINVVDSLIDKVVNGMAV